MIDFLTFLAAAMSAAVLFLLLKRPPKEFSREEFRRLHEALKQLEKRMDQEMKDNRKELRDYIRDLKEDTGAVISHSSRNQAELMRIATEQLKQLKSDVEKQLDQIRKENGEKLDRMKQTVDVKLENTLKQRLDDSFSKVSELLSQVNRNLGQVHSLTDNVSTLNRMLNNVKQRGNFGEIQLENILEDLFAPDQYIKNAPIQGRQRVEIAIKLPSADQDQPYVLLPVDAKFPEADYQKLIEAQESGDKKQVEEAQKELSRKIREEAKNIGKYIHPPLTADFAVMFLPTESLFAEVLRIPGLFDEIRQNHQVIITGPTTLAAFLHSVRIGFRAMAIQKQTTEVLRLLQGIHKEFGQFSSHLESAKKKLEDAEKAINKAFTDTQKIRNNLDRVQHLSIPGESPVSSAS